MDIKIDLSFFSKSIQRRTLWWKSSTALRNARAEHELGHSQIHDLPQPINKGLQSHYLLLFDTRKNIVNIELCWSILRDVFNSSPANKLTKISFRKAFQREREREIEICSVKNLPPINGITKRVATEKLMHAKVEIKIIESFEL